MSLFSTLIMGARSLKTFQEEIQTTAHNISNANTPGYSRQSPLLRTVESDKTDTILIGRGVELTGIQRLHLSFLDAQSRQESGNLGHSESLSSTYQLLEPIFNEPSDHGLSQSMSKFWNGWQELANDPTNIPLRASLRSDAISLASSINQANGGLNDLRKSLNEEITNEVGNINILGNRLAELNSQIKTHIFRGEQPNDLLDERDQLLDDLSKKIDMSVIDKGQGQINVHIQGTMFVDELGSHAMTVVPRTGDPLGLVDVHWKDTNLTVDMNSGGLQGLLDSRDKIVPGFSDDLNVIAAGIIKSVNDIHREGMGLDGSVKLTGALSFSGTLTKNETFGLNGVDIHMLAGDDLNTIVSRINLETTNTGVEASMDANRLVLSAASVNPQTIRISSDPDKLMQTLGIRGDFFSGTNAADISVSDSVMNNLSFIAASQSGAPGDNNNAEAIAALRDALTLKDDTMSFNGYYRVMMTDLGSESQASDFVKTNQMKLVEQMSNMKQSVSGVSLDEELTELMKYQRSYEMAAKVIQTANEMLQRLLEIG